MGKTANSPMNKTISIQPTNAMRLAGARRLLQFQEGTKDSDFSVIQWIAAKNDAERVWRSMWLESENPIE